MAQNQAVADLFDTGYIFRGDPQGGTLPLITYRAAQVDDPVIHPNINCALLRPCLLVEFGLDLPANLGIAQLLGFSAYDWRADEYISFVCKFLLGMGLGFQFPLVVLFMVKLGLITPQSFGFNLALAPAVFVGALAGRWLLIRVNQQLFEKLVLGLSAIAGVLLIV